MGASIAVSPQFCVQAQSVSEKDRHETGCVTHTHQNRFDRYIERYGESRLTNAMKTASVLSAGKILVVDDVSANVQLLTTLLTREGYSVVSASDGEQALEMV